MNIPASELIEALKEQRNGLADDAAVLRAALKAAEARVAELEAKLSSALAQVNTE